MKRYSTVGMGPSQGKLSNINAARHLANVTGQSLADRGPHDRASAVSAGEPGRDGGTAAFAAAPHADGCLA